MQRQEYQFLELCRKWGSLTDKQKSCIVGYTRHKRAAGFGLVIPAAALFALVVRLFSR